MFGKSISQLNLADIQSLVDSQEKENAILEYKQEIKGSDKEKWEISKDISALANTNGGYLIVGIQEKDGRASAIVGTDRKIGRQPVEEWIESILISNIRPRVVIKPQVIEISDATDKVLVVVHVPQSFRRPHMVAVDSRNAYFSRHNYQTTYADEHEVRAMFLEGKVSGDEMKNFLDSHNLSDTNSPAFATNPLSQSLAEAIKIRELPETFSGKPFVLFSACPRYLEERVDIATEDFRSWLDTNNTINLFALNIDFLDYSKEISSDSIRSINGRERKGEGYLWRYVEIFRNGYVEQGTGPEFMWSHGELGLMFQLAYFTGAFWLFMKFINNLYQKIGYIDEVKLTVALVDVEGVVLHGFGNKNAGVKWLQPYDFMHGDNIPKCRQKNVKIERSFLATELNESRIEEITKDISKRVSNAFGVSIAKCFDDSGVFDRNQLRGFRNVS